MYMYVYMYMHIYVYVCTYMYVCIHIYMYVCIYIHIYVYVYVCMYIYMCIYVYIYVSIYICICIYVCVYMCMCIFICICTYKFVHVCMRTLVDVTEGPYHPLRFGCRGCCFDKSENTESGLYTASPYGLVDLQLPHSFDRRYHIHLSVSFTMVYPPQVVLSCTSSLRTYC